MRHSKWASAALASVAVAAWVALPGARPRYGGQLTLEIAPIVRSLDPSTWLGEPPELAAKARLVPLVFETLVDLDDAGRFRPCLAASWETDAGKTRWLFRLAPGLTLHDGPALTALQVAERIKAAVPAWELRASRDTIEIRPDRPSPDLLWELARPELAIAVEAPDGRLLGTGPFRIDRIDSNRAIELRSHDGYRGGRPFLDRVVVQMGRSPADQLLDLELGRADLVSVAPQDFRRLAAAGLQVAATRPVELLAIARDRSASPATTVAMRGLAAAIDRNTIVTVLLDRQAEPAGALLPEWLSGYAPVLTARRDIEAARTIVRSLGAADRTLALQFDANDPAVRSVAERVVADAREAELQVRLVGWQRGPRPAADLVLVRVALGATSPDRALTTVADALDLAQTDPSINSLLASSAVGSLEDVARAELHLLDAAAVIPLAHQRSLYGLARRVRGWSTPVISPSTGRWNLADAWLAPETP